MKSRRTFLALVFLVTIFGCQSGSENAIPDVLLGVWKTSEPKYADRFFELKKDEIIFGIGGDEANTYRVASVEKTHDEEGLLYNIFYLNPEGQQYTFSIYFDPRNQGVIRFKNQKQFIWMRKER